MSFRKLKQKPCVQTEQPSNCLPCVGVNAALDDCCDILCDDTSNKDRLLKALPTPARRIPPKNLGKNPGK